MNRLICKCNHEQWLIYPDEKIGDKRFFCASCGSGMEFIYRTEVCRPPYLPYLLKNKKERCGFRHGFISTYYGFITKRMVKAKRALEIQLKKDGIDVRDCFWVSYKYITSKYMEPCYETKFYKLIIITPTIPRRITPLLKKLSVRKRLNPDDIFFFNNISDVHSKHNLFVRES